ncbi:chemotaxis protein CheW [Moritella sp. Urea-trap-13]|uniref:chemotaxis protein CheW n=1 Tax=Moritella sp. Urea-trap-13 TaxID=2058327 RepID=UPI000C33ACC6|nr:chemotaxis protein CheW [Moritella sp. Urea-trap-13]PKH07519.1 chemotaxis protein CheW [Moritella sp. Urea-trap-13]
MDNNTLTEIDEQSTQFLTFIMAEEEYGVEILDVQEIRGWESCTEIPNMPAYVKGVINLRGTIVPIVDLRQKFGLENIEYSAITVVIVVKVLVEDKSKVMGLVVDAVSDVHTIAHSDINLPPQLGPDNGPSVIRGLVSIKDKMVVLLSSSLLLDLEQFQNIETLNMHNTPAPMVANG